MNEPSSFVDGSASNSTMSLENTTVVPRMCFGDPDVGEERLIIGGQPTTLPSHSLPAGLKAILM